TPSRHLGLVPAAERAAEATAGVDRLGELVARCVDLDAVLAVARRVPALRCPPWDATAEVGRQGERERPHATVALASGPAFTFAYAETAELLRAAGVEVVPVDPLRDAALPDGATGLYLGGGFPEVYSPALAANEPLRRAVASFRGAVYAECAGLLYLCRSLDGHAMTGVLDADARMAARLVLGYRDGRAPAETLVASAGDAVSGHEFHRTEVTPAHGSFPAWRLGNRAEGFATERVLASYLHVHWAGHPAMARRFAARAVAA
ncbi:MAG: cobyrinic acid a,c-diamide synthase, partial [Actinomycetota bacterium]|nr:cobyrinic acid a,c-diamide synthase [Actinomycetota bacterium]